MLDTGHHLHTSYTNLLHSTTIQFNYFTGCINDLYGAFENPWFQWMLQFHMAKWDPTQS